MKYKLNPNVVLVTILDESMLVTVGNKMNCVENMKGINEAGVYLWKQLEKGLDTEEITAQAAVDYEISLEEARSAVRGFYETLRDAGYIIIEE